MQYFLRTSLATVFFVPTIMATPLHGQPHGCENWISKEFFAIANKAQIEQCVDGANPNSKNEYGLTPLHWAARFSNDPEVINALLDNGAELDQKDSEGVTPLHIAARFSNDPEVIDVLLKGGADLNSKDVYGLTPLHWAAGGNTNTEVIQELIAEGAKLNSVDNYGRTPLHIAAEAANLSTFSDTFSDGIIFDGLAP